jgi:hypothetical protein
VAFRAESWGKLREEKGLVLLDAIARYAPYAAGFGEKGKGWEEVASSLSASLVLPFTSRAPTQIVLVF